MQSIAPILLAGLLAAAVIVYFYREHIHEKRLRLRVQKLYASQLFEDMMPMLRYARKRPLEKVVVDKTGVLLKELGAEESAFLMRPNGYNYLTPDQQEAMRLVLEECIPKLCDASNYRVMRRRIVLLNGDVEYAYQYTMSNAYKSRLSRAVYYDGTLQMRSW